MITNTQLNPAQLSQATKSLIENNAGGKAVKDERAMHAAREFESVFLTSMLENMFTGVELEEPFGGGQAEKIYRSMQIAEYAKEISKNGGIGIREHVYRELLAIQEGGVR